MKSINIYILTICILTNCILMQLKTTALNDKSKVKIQLIMTRFSKQIAEKHILHAVLEITECASIRKEKEMKKRIRSDIKEHIKCIGNKSSNSPNSNSWAIVSGDERQAEIEWLARYGGNDAKCGDTEGPFIYMGSPLSTGGWKRDGKRKRERERDRVGAQVAARKRPRGHGAQASSSCPAPFIPPTLPPSRDEMRRWKDLFTLTVSRTILFSGNVFIKKLFPHTSRRPVNDV